MDELADRLAATMPPPTRASIVHNDLKLDNCQFDPADPDRVRSIFDWDMTTLGEPLVDLGTLLNYWPDPSDGRRTPRAARGAGVDGAADRREVTDRYAERTGLDVSSAGWYEAFAQWKTGGRRAAAVPPLGARREHRPADGDDRRPPPGARGDGLGPPRSALNHRYLVAATTLQVNGVTRLPSGWVHGAMMPTDSSRSCW